MPREEMTRPSLKPYAAPVVTDYGDLRELTAAHTNAGLTDVPRGTPGPNVFC